MINLIHFELDVTSFELASVQIVKAGLFTNLRAQLPPTSLRLQAEKLATILNI